MNGTQLFSLSNIPATFIADHISCCETFASNQINTINTNLQSYASTSFKKIKYDDSFFLSDSAQRSELFEEDSHDKYHEELFDTYDDSFENVHKNNIIDNSNTKEVKLKNKCNAIDDIGIKVEYFTKNYKYIVQNTKKNCPSLNQLLHLARTILTNQDKSMSEDELTLIKIAFVQWYILSCGLRKIPKHERLIPNEKVFKLHSYIIYFK